MGTDRVLDTITPEIWTPDVPSWRPEYDWRDQPRIWRPGLQLPPLLCIGGPVQEAHGSGASGFSVTITAPGAGNILILESSLDGGNITSITTTGATWSVVTTATPTNQSCEIWIASGATGTSVKVNHNSTSAFVHISEWSALTTTTDGTGDNAGTGSSDSLTLVTTNLVDLVIHAVAQQSQQALPTAGGVGRESRHGPMRLDRAERRHDNTEHHLI